MKTSLFIRVPLTFLAAVATFYFVFWLPGAFISELPAGMLLSFIVSLVSAGFTGRYIWKTLGTSSAGLLSFIFTGSMICGAIGFCGGFFGPMIFAPGANQGPLLGILITGPLGFLLGGIAGGLYWKCKK